MGMDAYGYPDTKWINYYKKTYGVRESLAKVKAFLDIEITKRKPRFLGEPIPLDGNGIITDG
jgi:vancomycin permeability regulator SanA